MFDLRMSKGPGRGAVYSKGSTLSPAIEAKGKNLGRKFDSYPERESHHPIIQCHAISTHL